MAILVADAIYDEPELDDDAAPSVLIRGYKQHSIFCSEIVGELL